MCLYGHAMNMEGNKCDLSKFRTVPESAGQAVLSKWREKQPNVEFGFIETSPKEHINSAEWIVQIIRMLRKQKQKTNERYNGNNSNDCLCHSHKCKCILL